MSNTDPYKEKQLADIELKNENYDEAIKIYLNAILIIKVKFDEDAEIDETTATKYIEEIAVKLL